MSDCHNIRDQIGPFVEGDLSPEQGEKVADHLDACLDCQAVEHDFRALAELLSPAPASPEMDEQPAWRRFDADLARRLAENDQRRRGLYIPLPAAAALAVLLVGAVTMGLSAHQRSVQLQVQQQHLTEALLELQDSRNLTGLRTVSTPAAIPQVVRFDPSTLERIFTPPPEFGIDGEETSTAAARTNARAIKVKLPSPAEFRPAKREPARRNAAAIHYVDVEYQKEMY